MAGLRLGPLLRYVDADSATVWVETDRPCVVHVRCDDGAAGAQHTWQVAGHHYALVPVTGLTPGSETPYQVLLDDEPGAPPSGSGEKVWPLPDSRFPASTIRTLPASAHEPLHFAFGSCRWSATPSNAAHDPVGPDALDTLAATLAAGSGRQRPDVLLLLGDQVYADQTSEATAQVLAGRRDLTEPPWKQVADYEEYTYLYYESWLDPEVRWLLSTVPSCMIFDDHDVIDDWNTSASWLARMRATPWWRERILGGLMSYWVHQHLGNLSPAELAADELYAQVQSVPDATELVREFAAGADADAAHARWSYRRDFGRVRLVMIDTRATRVLDESNRAMLDKTEGEWLRQAVLDGRGSYDHLLLGSSLPWLLPHLIHAGEGWNAALCAGERGPRWARRSERLRQRADLEHWSAFPGSFTALTELIAEAGSGAHAPATVCVLSGDVHHAYVAEPHWRGAGPHPASRVLQLTCSPVHNSIPGSLQAGFRFGWSRSGRWLGKLLARHGRLPRPAVKWRRTGGPWFGNQLMTLTLAGRAARLALDQTRREKQGGVRLVTVWRAALTDARVGGESGGAGGPAAGTERPKSG
ncbi:Phosphodiesterase/alkaline phosphatase D [Streptomyces sp. SceaMP-e96]|uniref:alkaline phosphatase D family protein n=1 Tax=Streptomyces TaxID=1883 RepID=UPI000823C291|nr:MULTISPECIES: alkaline phosphatase D family protein [unclassified Streptomyces]MYT12801.1 alkaline phosphatase family protein [Streptomyces sp. SID4951]SCK38709.1 Phosphodiesterase/alkaline phosphatase D [Streptomyces sp. SceaMP-e96]